MTLFKSIRIVILLLIFAFVAFYSKSQRLQSRAWTEPLEVVIYPINGDRSASVEDYIARLDAADFASIDRFFREEGESYPIIADHPTETRLGPILIKQPPPSPLPDASALERMWWGVRFRWWSFLNTPDSDSNLRRVRIFTHYHDAVAGRRLQHSLGLDKGLLAIVHAFASPDQNEQNNIVIAHELLHTVGATDKYDNNEEPSYPDGYAAPDQKPLFPQRYAEIMSGRIPLSPRTSRMASSLDECVVGRKTAMEINWLRQGDS
ncbi:MAG: hypothetical protein ACU826_08540 [Gammaproteobacteria bacterium]